MKFDSSEYSAAHELFRLQEQNARLFGSIAISSALEAAKTPAQRLGFSESAWQQAERAIKLQEEVENAERFGLTKSVWNEVQQHAKLQEVVNRTFGLDSAAAYLDDKTRASIFGVTSKSLEESLKQIKLEQQVLIEYPAPPMLNFNVKLDLQREQVEISKKQLGTAQQSRKMLNDAS